jgi:putative tryptophan/tyrosine transport system substrate-binding protein
MRLSRRQVVQGVGLTGLGLLAGCGRWPGQSRPAKVARIGYLGPGSNAPNFEAFRQGLQELGYDEGQNVLVEYRSANDQPARFPALADELVSLPVDVIVASAALPALAASRATKTIPIVMATGGDPVRLGLAASLARPGGNVTGLSTLSPALSGKRLELLREAAPSIARVAIMTDSTNPSGADQLRETQAAAQQLGLETMVLDRHSPEGLDAEFRTATRGGADSFCLLAIALNRPEYLRVAEFTTQSRLPSVSALREGADHGGLLAYGPSVMAQNRRAAAYVDRILKGANPADLPIEQAMIFDFIINAKTAQALGLTIPPHVLLQATEIIQ